MTDWLWEQNERQEQRERSLDYKRKKTNKDHDLDRQFVTVRKKVCKKILQHIIFSILIFSLKILDYHSNSILDSSLS